MYHLGHAIIMTALPSNLHHDTVSFEWASESVHSTFCVPVLMTKVEVTSSKFKMASARKPGDWTCSKCQFNVFGSKAECGKCGTANPWMRRGDWACSECKYNNFANRETCLRCKRARPDPKQECVVCRTEAPTHAPAGCGHRCLCEKCAGLMKGKPCPMCRKPITNYIRVYV